MARALRTHKQADVRAKIQAVMLINRLQDHVEGKNQMTATQIQAAKILLDKAVSNAPTELTGAGGGAIVIHATSRDEAA